MIHEARRAAWRWPADRARPSGRRGPALALLLLGALARPARAETLTLEAAVARALQANPSVRAARLASVAAQARSGQALARHLGDADLLGGASRFESRRLIAPLAGPVTPAVIAGLPFDRDQVHYGVAWQIPLFVGGALVEGDRAAELAEAAARSAEARAREELRYNVRAAYRSVLVVRHALAAAGAYEEALARDDASARLRVETAAWAPADAAKVSFARASATARAAALAAQLRSATGLLAALLGEDPAAARYELEDLPDEPIRAAPPAAELGEIALARRSDLRAAGEGAAAGRARVAATTAGFWPQLSFVGNVFENRGVLIDRQVETWELTLQVKIPLFSDLGRFHAAREARAAAAEAEERARAKALEVAAQVVDAEGRVEAARAALAAGRSQRALGAEVARVEKLRFEAGTDKVEDYLSARASELDGETGYWAALYALQSAHDYLELASGTGGSP